MIRIALLPLGEGSDDAKIAQYLAPVQSAGADAEPIAHTTDEAALSSLADAYDGFVFPGGVDVAPSFYGEEDRACERIDDERDAMESALLRILLERDKPVLGICRGMQMMNVVLGGTLWQNIPSEYPSAVSHRGSAESPASHPIRALPGGLLEGAFGEAERQVNSFHHQGVRELAPSLFAEAVSPDGLVEAFSRRESRFFVGVQWHPERMAEDALSRFLMRCLVEAAWKR